MKSPHRSMHLNGGETVNHISDHDGGSVIETYIPFDIKNGSNEDINNKSLSIDSKNPVSAANVLKTLFFILVWYTFSLFLTLYNKSLLGDDMGRFPAPLLMNTFHFTMQAVLSKSITWFWSHRFQPKVVMSWRDYFVRVVPTALGTSLDINLSNASLVSFSVTFATMVGVTELQIIGHHLNNLGWNTPNSCERNGI